MKFQVFCLIFLIIDAIVVITFASSNQHHRRNKNSHQDLTNIDCNALRRHYDAQNHKNFNRHDTKLQLLCELNTDTNISYDTTTDETSELSVENKTVQCVGKKCVYKRKQNSSFNKSDRSSNESSEDKHRHHIHHRRHGHRKLCNDKSSEYKNRCHHGRRNKSNKSLSKSLDSKSSSNENSNDSSRTDNVNSNELKKKTPKNKHRHECHYNTDSRHYDYSDCDHDKVHLLHVNDDSNDSSHKSKRSITSFRREHSYHDRPHHHHGRNSHHHPHKHNHHCHHHQKQHPRHHHNSKPHHFHQTPNYYRPGHRPRHHRRYPDFYNSSEEYLAKCKYRRGRHKYYKCKDKYINSNTINQKPWIASTTTNDLPSVTSTTPLPPNIFKISTTELPPPKLPVNNFEATSSTEITSTTEKPIETTTEIDLSLYERADIQTKPPCTQHTSVVEQTDEKFLYFNGENVQYEINLCNN